MRTDYKEALRARAAAGAAHVFTDPLASPTSFPLKVASLEGTLSDQAVYDDRPRVCDLGYLREAYRTADGHVAFRCAAEPVSVYASKGGNPDDVRGRKCICNALVATMGLPQVRGGEPEPAIITTGNALEGLTRFMPPGGAAYTAADVVARLLSAAPSARP